MSPPVVPPVAPQRPPRIPKSPPPEVVDGPQIAQLESELAACGPPAEARRAVVDRFWAAVARDGAPLVAAPWPSDPHHRAVTFLWRDRHGTQPGTRTVTLLANKVTDPSVWQESQLHRVAGTDVWHRTYRLPADWQGTYQLAPDDGPVPVGDAAGPAAGPRSRWAGVATAAVHDPFCGRQLAGRPGELPTSVAVLEHAPAQPYRDRRPGQPRGRLTERHLAAAGLAAPRRLWIYTPPEAPAPPTHHDLLVVLDGEDWAGRLDLVSTLDNLISDGAIAPTVAVLIDAVDTAARWRELACDDTFTSFLTGPLLDWARAELPVSGDPSRTTVTGRSLGGLTALYAGLRAPARVGRVIAQSTSLWWPSEPAGDRRPGWLPRQLLQADALPAEITLQVGRQEWLLLEPARELAAGLRRRGGVAVDLHEYEGGHDAWWWRGGLADALAHTTPQGCP